MAFSNELAKAGHTPEEVRTKADVTFVPGTGITGSHLTVSARIPGISEEEFQKIAGEAKVGCPVSGALASIDITLDATLDS
jgi:osmotically inducible protein OsmC